MDAGSGGGKDSHDYGASRFGQVVAMGPRHFLREAMGARNSQRVSGRDKSLEALFSAHLASLREIYPAQRCQDRQERQSPKSVQPILAIPARALCTSNRIGNDLDFVMWIAKPTALPEFANPRRQNRPSLQFSV